MTYTQHIPVRVIAKMLGLPQEDGDEFRMFIHRILETPGQHEDIDTTWSAIGASLWQLAQHPEDRRRWAEDTEVGGCPVKREDWLLLSFPSYNRDPEAFERADEFVIDRAKNRHSAFGLGIHRCLGSNLARLELTVAVEEWMARFPDFELSDPHTVRWSTGQVRGPRCLPVRILRGGAA